MHCATRWRFPDECIKILMASFCETLQQPAHDWAPSPYKLRKMMEMRSSVTAQDFPVCAKECSVLRTPFDQMTADEIADARCPICDERYINGSGKRAKPEKVSYFKASQAFSLVDKE